MNVIQNLPRKDYRPQHCDYGINNLLARERWQQRKVARLGWIGSLIAIIVLIALFALAAHADMVTVSYPQPDADPDLGFDLPACFMCLGLGAIITFVCWQAKVSVPLIFNRDQPGAGRK